MLMMLVVVVLLVLMMSLVVYRAGAAVAGTAGKFVIQIFGGDAW